MTRPITKLYGHAQAPLAQGVTVVIDVIRAFTNAAFALAGGATDVVPVRTKEEAFAWREKDPRCLLAGEIGGDKIDGFDLSNSPEAMEAADVAGRRIVLRTGNGTQGAVLATDATQLLFGSFPVAEATVRWIERMTEGPITLLAMMSTNGPDGDEDVALADYLEARLRGERADPAPFLERVRNSEAGQMAWDPAIHWQSPGDVERAATLDCFDFAMVAERTPEGIVGTARRADEGTVQA